MWWLSHRPVRNLLPVSPVNSPLGPATVAPLNVPALGYLSPQTDFVVVIQTRPLEEYAKRTNRSPESIGNSLGLVKPLRDQLADRGLPWDAIDQLAIGVICDANDAIPIVQAVIIVRQPLANAREIATAFEKSRWGLIALTSKWIDDTTLILASRPEMIIATARPATGEHLPGPLKEAIAQQLSPSSWAWAASTTKTWHDLPTVQALQLLDTDHVYDPWLKPIRALVLGLSFEPEFSVGVAVKTDSDDSAKKLRDHFGVRGADWPCQVGGEPPWATLEMTIEPEKLKAAAAHFLKR
jgi:hypothetical protein